MVGRHRLDQRSGLLKNTAIVSAMGASDCGFDEPEIIDTSESAKFERLFMSGKRIASRKAIVASLTCRQDASVLGHILN
jgi:hypothetical protein